MFKRIRDEIDVVFERDPAVRSRIEVIFCYPGFHALLFYHMSHWCWTHGLKFLGRFISHIGRILTGIEIHPAVRIGKGLFIDHGMGVVIGETAEIGDNVTLYHGVTLGGIAPSVDSESQVNQKRHPTLEDDVIIGSGAQVLGPITVAKGCRVGANAVVVKNVPAGHTVAGIPARTIGGHDASKPQPFAAYGAPSPNMPDPTSRAIDGLLDQLDELSSRILQIEAEQRRMERNASPGFAGPEDGDQDGPEDFIADKPAS
ncbi:MAG: serine O-acetyltransferase [Proteobacteria bacterium]|nr:serine O-acetyltransferase [Pseudomonadota bacterium]